MTKEEGDNIKFVTAVIKNAISDLISEQRCRSAEGSYRLHAARVEAANDIVRHFSDNVSSPLFKAASAFLIDELSGKDCVKEAVENS